MKAPDKIYIQPNAHDGWFENNSSDLLVAYIRKDALLEWLKRKQNTTLKVVEDDLIQEVIDHINEM